MKTFCKRSILILIVVRTYPRVCLRRCGTRCRGKAARGEAAYNLVTTIKYVNYYYDNINRVYFDLPWQQWSLLNRFCMEQGHVVTVEGNDDLQTLICVHAARLR